MKSRVLFSKLNKTISLLCKRPLNYDRHLSNWVINNSRVVFPSKYSRPMPGCAHISMMATQPLSDGPRRQLRVSFGQCKNFGGDGHALSLLMNGFAFDRHNLSAAIRNELGVLVLHVLGHVREGPIAAGASARGCPFL